MNFNLTESQVLTLMEYDIAFRKEFVKSALVAFDRVAPVLTVEQKAQELAIAARQPAGKGMIFAIKLLRQWTQDNGGDIGLAKAKELIVKYDPLETVESKAEQLARTAYDHDETKVAAIKKLREWSMTVPIERLKGYDFHPANGVGNEGKTILGLAQAKKLIEFYMNLRS